MKKVAIITGAGRGIGAAVACGLANEEYEVVLIARKREQLEQVAQEIGKPTAIFALDVRDLTAVESCVCEVIERFGKIDLLFNNAGIFFPGTTSIGHQDFRDQIDINLIGAFHVLKSCYPHFKRQGFGHIFNMSSKAGLIGFANAGAYAATKFGLRGLSEALYRELCPHGIKVTTLCPSWVNTELAQSSSLEDHEKIDTADIVKTVKWLISLSPAACIREVLIECRLAID